MLAPTCRFWLLMLGMCTSTGKEFQYIDATASPAPLGIELSEKLAIVGFSRDKNGNLPKWAASAGVREGDELIGINGRNVTGSSLRGVAQII